MDNVVNFDTSNNVVSLEALYDDLSLTISHCDLVVEQIIEISDKIAQEGFVDSAIAILKELLNKIIVFFKKIALKLSSVFNEYNFYALRMLKDRWLNGKIHYYYTPAVNPALSKFCKALHLFNNNILAAIPDALIESNKTLLLNVNGCIDSIKELSNDNSKLEEVDLSKFKNIHTNNVDFIYLDENEIYAVNNNDITKLEVTVDQFVKESTSNNVSGEQLLTCLNTIRSTNSARLKLTSSLYSVSREIEKLLKSLDNTDDTNIKTRNSRIKLICQDIPTKSLKTIVRFNKESLKFIDIMRKCTFTHPLQLGFVQKIDVLGYHATAPHLPDMATTAKYYALHELDQSSKYKHAEDRAKIYEKAETAISDQLTILYEMEKQVIGDRFVEKKTINGIEFYDIVQKPTMLECGFNPQAYLGAITMCCGFTTMAGKVFTCTGVLEKLAASKLYSGIGVTYDMLVNFILAHEHGHKVDLCGGKELTFDEFVNGKFAYAEGRNREQEVYADAYSIKKNGFDLETYKKLRDGLLVAIVDASGIFGSSFADKGVIGGFLRGTITLPNKIMSYVNSMLGAYNFNRAKCYEFSKEIKI